MKLILIGTLLLQVATAVPDGVDAFKWGISAEQLMKSAPARKADPAHGYGYSDHSEADPDVYVSVDTQGTRREYYFFRGKLYKSYTVYDRAYTHPDNYNKRLAELTQLHGPPARKYEDQTLGLRVIHAEWTSETSTLDLRMGAGFIYEVRFQNEAAREKQTAQQMKKSI